MLSQLKAGLKPGDFEPIQLVDQNATAAAFNSGRVDLYSGSTPTVAESIDKGAARVLLTSDELGIPALGVFTARGDVLRDPAKHAALADFLTRLNRHWSWYANNLDAIEQIFVTKIGQTPARAKLTALYLKANFQPLDADLVEREQHIANVLFEAGAIQKKIEVGVEFDGSFNADAAGQ